MQQFARRRVGSSPRRCSVGNQLKHIQLRPCTCTCVDRSKYLGSPSPFSDGNISRVGGGLIPAVQKGQGQLGSRTPSAQTPPFKAEVKAKIRQVLRVAFQPPIAGLPKRMPDDATTFFRAVTRALHRVGTVSS